MSTQTVTESLWTSMPQQREYSICIGLLCAAEAWTRQETRHSFSCSPRLAARRQHYVVPKQRPARFTNGLEAPDQHRLFMPRDTTRMPLSQTVFIPRCGQRGARPCMSHNNLREL